MKKNRKQVQILNALHLPAVRTILRKRSIILTGPLIWNQLNPDFYILPSVASFKFNYKKFLISVCRIYISSPILYGYIYV